MTILGFGLVNQDTTSADKTSRVIVDSSGCFEFSDDSQIDLADDSADHSWSRNHGNQLDRPSS